MAKPTVNWDPAFLRPPHRPLAHSTWVEKVESARTHGYFSLLTSEESSEAIGIDQLPIVIANRLAQVLQLRRLEEQVADLTDRLDNLEATAGRSDSKVVMVQTFAPEPYSLLTPISITIEEDTEGGFLASFFDAGISTAGETEQEAFDNVKNLILDVFDSLNREKAEDLGPDPARQLAVLRSFICGA